MPNADKITVPTGKQKKIKRISQDKHGFKRLLIGTIDR